ncbi:HD-GYP domain-containing protein [Thermodesulfobacteriota bacterium]
MVRFSDIIKERDKKSPAGESHGKKVEKDKFRLSDSQAFKTMGDNQVSIDISPRENADLEIATYYKKFIERASDIRERIKGEQGISPSPILSDLHYIIDKDLINKLYEYAMSAQVDYEEMLIHTIDVTFTSLKVGKGTGYDTKMLLRLGLAAFLENVGMYRIPDSILKSTGKLGEEEIKLIKKHPEMSYERLLRLGEKYKWLADVALQIHERSDGSGYPSGLKGGDILELASLIGLVDTYVAMIKNRPYRDEVIQTDAIKSIVEYSKRLFPPKIVKIFLTQISMFPVNSYIKLNNGSVGRVISTDMNQPLRPTIELLFDRSGNRLSDKPVICLSDNPLLYIDHSVGVNELP